MGPSGILEDSINKSESSPPAHSEYGRMAEKGAGLDNNRWILVTLLCA